MLRDNFLKKSDNSLKITIFANLNFRNMRKLFKLLAIAIAAVVITLTGCKKKEENLKYLKFDGKEYEITEATSQVGKNKLVLSFSVSIGTFQIVIAGNHTSLPNGKFSITEDGEVTSKFITNEGENWTVTGSLIIPNGTYDNCYITANGNAVCNGETKFLIMKYEGAFANQVNGIGTLIFGEKEFTLEIGYPFVYENVISIILSTGDEETMAVISFYGMKDIPTGEFEYSDYASPQGVTAMIVAEDSGGGCIKGTLKIDKDEIGIYSIDSSGRIKSANDVLTDFTLHYIGDLLE